MFIIPKVYKEEISAIKAFNKILLPSDPRHYVKNIYCTGKGGRLLFTDAKAIFAINTGFNIPKGYYNLAKVGSDQALIQNNGYHPDDYEYPSHEDLFTMCTELIEGNYFLNLNMTSTMSSSFINLCHSLSCSGHIHIIDLKYFQMLPGVTYELLIDRKDGHPFATHFKNEKYEAIIMPIRQ